MKEIEEGFFSLREKRSSVGERGVPGVFGTVCMCMFTLG